MICVAALLTTTGCTTAAKQAFHEVLGARGEIKFIDEPSPEELDQYQSLRFEPAQTTIGPRLCPPALQRSYDAYADKLVLDLRDRFPGGEPMLTISTEILYFQEKGLFGAAQLLTRLKFTGGDRPVGDAIVVVGSKAFRAGSAGALTEASVETIGEFLKAGSPEEEDEEGDQQ